jgi:hypothetical protein
MGDEAALALAAALPSCPGLEALALGGNCLADRGALALLAALDSGACPNLRFLSLEGNRWAAAGQHRGGASGLAEALAAPGAQTLLPRPAPGPASLHVDMFQFHARKQRPAFPPHARFPLEWETLLRARGLAAVRPGLRVELLGPGPAAGAGMSEAGAHEALRLSKDGGSGAAGHGGGCPGPAPRRTSPVALSRLLSSSNGAPADAGVGGHARDSGGDDWSVSSDDLCGVCFDRPNSLHVLGCGHLLCIPCYRRLLRASASGPAAAGAAAPSCPFCRGRIDGFAYAGWLRRAAEHHLAPAAETAAPAPPQVAAGAAPTAAPSAAVLASLQP